MRYLSLFSGIEAATQAWRPLGWEPAAFLLAEHGLTETVRNYEQYLPEYLPMVHPSPLNFRWFAKNPWFEADLVPVMQGIVAMILES